MTPQRLARLARRALGGAVAALVLAAPPGAAAPPPPVDYVTPVAGPITRHFEPPLTPFGPGHRGIDIRTQVGTVVRAAAHGVVAFAGPVGGEIFVSVDHADGLRSTYSFLSAVTVRAGQRVSQGDALARSGAGHGGSADPHLHFGIRRGSEYLDPEALVLASLRRNLWRIVWIGPDPPS